MKLITVVGARPQFIKAAAVSAALASQSVEEVLVHTGQHYDSSMSDVFFDELGIRPPNYNLGISGGSHGTMTGNMLIRLEEVLQCESPHAVLVYGDTNSTLAASLAASKLHIPIIHIEAGLRSWNKKMPEEINRILTDHVSELLFCPSQQAVKNLNNEGITEGVHEVGDVMADMSNYVTRRLPTKPAILDRLNLISGEYLLATCHRAENTDNAESLSSILKAFGQLPYPIALPLHPRAKSAIIQHKLTLPDNIITSPPLGYLDMMALLKHAHMVLTDSGGLQKEAYWMKKTCLTLRNETEWTETLDNGWNHLVGTHSEKIIAMVNTPLKPNLHPELYGDGKAAIRCAKLITNYFG